MTEDERPGLAEAIEAVRSELARAQDLGRSNDVRFTVAGVEVELAVDVTKTAGGGASVTVLGLLSVGGSGARSWGETNRVKVSLNPLGVGGEPYEVASELGGRPDGASAK